MLPRCDEDDPDYPNEGWLWTSHYRPPWSYAEDCKKGLRDWGYVFWDRPRLEAWGVLDKEWVSFCPPLSCNEMDVLTILIFSPDELAEYRFDEDAREETDHRR